ncbi:MAG: hypothetical protein Rubg2KO_17610 [Rubricoccaceae bacterium]
MKKSILLVAAGVFALSGCDFAGSTDSATVPVASIEVSGLQTSNGQEAWDADGTAPDVYVEIRNAAGRAIYRSEVRENTDASSLEFSVDSEVEIPFSAMAMYINVYETDGDPVLAREMAASQAFTVDQLAEGDVELSDSARGTQMRVVRKGSVSDSPLDS